MKLKRNPVCPLAVNQVAQGWGYSSLGDMAEELPLLCPGSGKEDGCLPDVQGGPPRDGAALPDVLPPQEEFRDELSADLVDLLDMLEMSRKQRRLQDMDARTPEDWNAKLRPDREEIRRKLAMDTEDEDEEEAGSRRASLAARLQNNMNLQICFLNETASDLESLEDVPPKEPAPPPAESPPPKAPPKRPSFFFSRQRCRGQKQQEQKKAEDFHARHARLQAEARLALAQAKDMARMQVDIERTRKKKSPVAEIVGFPSAETHHLTRGRMNDMNLAQLQVIVNDLHSQIESLNEELVELLVERDDLHMEQDSMLVDIEDLNRYLGAKCEPLKTDFLTSPTKV